MVTLVFVFRLVCGVGVCVRWCLDFGCWVYFSCMGVWKVRENIIIVLGECTGCGSSRINEFVSCLFMSIHELCKRV